MKLLSHGVYITSSGRDNRMVGYLTTSAIYIVLVNVMLILIDYGERSTLMLGRETLGGFEKECYNDPYIVDVEPTFASDNPTAPKTRTSPPAPSLPRR